MIEREKRVKSKTIYLERIFINKECFRNVTVLTPQG